MIIFYDFECYRYDWLVVCIDPVNQKETVIVNDVIQMKQFYEKHKGDIWVGFNSRNYDQYILKGLIIGFDPYELSDWIVNKKRKGWEYSNLFNRIQLINYDVMTGYNGLKTLEGFMGKNIVETSVPFDLNRRLTKEEIDETIYYCRHDVQNTMEVFIRRKNEFDAQIDLVKEFGLPLADIGKTQAQLAAKILGARKIALDDEFDLRLPDTLKLGKYEYIGEWFMSCKARIEAEMGSINMGNYDEWRKEFYKQFLETEVGGIPHKFGWGGIHGARKKFSYKVNDNQVLIMRDVSSMYPSMMIVYNLLSRAITNKTRFPNIYNTNLRYKREKNKKRREPFKRICNIVYGATRDKNNAMYDPLHGNLICIFGQLFVVDLIDKIEDYITMVQSNTDGILFIVDKDKLPIINQLIDEWEKRIGIETEEDPYKIVVQKDVNNYIAIEENGSYKCKGAYVKKLDTLDYDLPIVNKAITEYIINEVPVEKTINDCDSLIEFQKIVKVSNKYLRAWHNDTFLTDKTFRVFASRNNEDTLIGRQKAVGETIAKFGNTPDHCFINNEDVNGKRIPRKLDKQWYIDLANKRLKQIYGEIEVDDDEDE